MTRTVLPIGNTVDIKNATYTNTIGAVELKTVWTDMEFEPSLDAFYYVRVLQIPTPRWSTYDAKRLGVPPPSSVPATVQERAWSSPIWYTPTTAARQDAPRGVTVADLKGKGAVALDDAQLKQLAVGQTLDVRNTVTGQRFEILYGADGRRVIMSRDGKPGETGDLLAVSELGLSAPPAAYEIRTARSDDHRRHPFEVTLYKVGDKYSGGARQRVRARQHEVQVTPAPALTPSRAASVIASIRGPDTANA
jgi:hypothetical protein